MTMPEMDVAVLIRDVNATNERGGGPVPARPPGRRHRPPAVPVAADPV